MIKDIEKQIQDFLRGEGNNVVLADGLLLEQRQYYGPVNINKTLLSRCTGPEENMKYKVSQESFNDRVNGIVRRNQTGWIIPPLLVNYCEGKTTINDGNHRYEAYKRMNYVQIPVLFWVTGEAEYERLVKWLKEIN